MDAGRLVPNTSASTIQTIAVLALTCPGSFSQCLLTTSTRSFFIGRNFSATASASQQKQVPRLQGDIVAGDTRSRRHRIPSFITRPAYISSTTIYIISRSTRPQLYSDSVSIARCTRDGYEAAGEDWTPCDGSFKDLGRGGCCPNAYQD